MIFLHFTLVGYRNFKIRGLLPESFELSSVNVSKGIALCPTCHTNFDAYQDPGLVVVPTNLEVFFIKFKVENYIKREEIAQRGVDLL